ncbi:uncharacterized protein TrAtP1_013159 [Trichoderma atroviride]|uniref:uncharacterized protein n=1 Tax=Hypocrea atroviridis TaxID=63577 RepID=UPI0033172DED|nr:hypothetical protein TrAtP1_013159 [Trichoderma atroviride]
MDSPTRKPAAAEVAPAPLTTTTSSASSTSSTSASSTSLSPLKRPAPSLLPPFEPSSSPGLPRPAKRQNVGSAPHLRYPTPNIPTSSTGILSSSPLREKLSRGISERTPLSAVPSIELNDNGEMLLMGRSSNSSHFQLSANRLISRVHVKARYLQGATPLEANKIEITCNGWNGLKLHCQGRTWELLKGDSFTSETEGTEIMVDVHDARVLIQWPKRSSSAVDANGLLSDASWEDSPPRSQTRASAMLQASPLRRAAARIQSPDSPTPAPRRRSVVAADEESGIQIYEDDEEHLPDSDGHEDPDVGVSMRTEVTASFSSDFEPDDEDDESDPDEENDPIIHSFGPYGANISGRMASISTKSPRVTSSKRALKKGSTETLVPRKSTRDLDSAEASPRKRARREASREQTPTPNGRPLKKEEDEEEQVKKEEEEEEEEEEDDEEEEEDKPPQDSLGSRCRHLQPRRQPARLLPPVFHAAVHHHAQPARRANQGSHPGRSEGAHRDHCLHWHHRAPGQGRCRQGAGERVLLHPRGRYRCSTSRCSCGWTAKAQPAGVPKAAQAILLEAP